MSDQQEFQLSPDFDPCAKVCDMPLCTALLMNEAKFPWLILVPRRPGLRDYHDLTADDAAQTTVEVLRASRVMAACFKPDKMNVAALGNMTPQLHFHIIARYRDDAAWPGPVWDSQPPTPMEQTQRDQWVRRIRELLDSKYAVIG